MTLRELLSVAGAYPWHLAAYFLAPPVAVLLLGLVHGRRGGALSPWRYVYSFIIYLVCVPGIFAAGLTAYALFFIRENLLDVNMHLYLLPIASMILTLALVPRNVSFDHVPGFNRLSGLMVMIGITFVVALGITKTRVWLLFGGSLFTLVVILIILFGALKWGAHLLFGRSNRSRGERRLAGR